MNGAELLFNLANGSETKTRQSIKAWRKRGWDGLPVRPLLRGKPTAVPQPAPQEWMCFCTDPGAHNIHDALIAHCLTCGAARPPEVQR